jgi:hypothetical protein
MLPTAFPTRILYAPLPCTLYNPCPSLIDHYNTLWPGVQVTSTGCGDQIEENERNGESTTHGP